METPILQYAGGVIAAKLDRTEKELVHGVSFHISRGESLALIGETGSGKTLIAQSVMGVLPGNVRLVSGEVLFCGKALPKGKKLRSMLGREIVYIPQNGHEFLDPSRSIRRQMFDSIAKLGIAAPLREAFAREKLTQVGFTQPEAILDRYAFQLSGGMAQRVTIALALCSQAKLLIADEPTNGLDQDSKQQTLSLLNDLFPDAAKLVITHDISVAATCGRILVLCGGKMLETGAGCPAPSLHPSPAGCLGGKWDAGNAGFADGGGRLSLLSPLSRSLRTMPCRNTPEDAGRQRMVVLQGMISMEQIDKVLQNVTLDIPDGQICGIFGKSGIGKSTLAKVLCGICPPDGGRILLDGQCLVSQNTPYDRKLGLSIQMVYQQPYATLDPRQKIGSGFKELIRYHGFAPRGEERALTEDVLVKVGLEPQILAHLPHQISGGEAQRVAIARCLLFRPKLLILDEATSMLDVSTQANVLGMVRRQMQEHHGSILLISHDEALVNLLCDQIYVFEKKHTNQKEKNTK